MFRSITAAALLVGTSVLAADDPKPPVSLEAEVVKPNPRLPPIYQPKLQVRLVGGGKEVAVITEGLGVSVVKAGKKSTVTLMMTKKEEHNGRLVVPSEVKLGLVKLQSGEVAIVHVPNSPELQEALKAAVAGEIELVVEYEVSDFWGKRFGAASGKLATPASISK